VLWFGEWDDPSPERETGLFVDDTLLVRTGVTTVGGRVIDELPMFQETSAISPNGRYVIFEADLDDGTNGAFLIDRGVRATAVLRNGGGGNDMVYTSASRPVLGSTWRAEVDTSSLGGGLTFLFGYEAPTSDVFLPWGELLVDPLSTSLFLSSASIGGHTHFNAVPNDVALLGKEVFTQAVVASFPTVLSNAVDLVLGN